MRLVEGNADEKDYSKDSIYERIQSISGVRQRTIIN